MTIRNITLFLVFILKIIHINAQIPEPTFDWANKIGNSGTTSARFITVDEIGNVYTWGVVKETIDILMQATPHNISIAEIKNAVESIDDVEDIHHVHVWKLNDEQIHLEAHINLKNNVDMVSMMKIKQEIEEIIRNNFGINHITLQIGYNCCINGEMSH